MSDLFIRLVHGRTAWAPGETMSGRVGWNGLLPRRRLELRMIWQATCAAGTETCTADVAPLAVDTPGGEQPFTLRVPDFPYSYVGGSLRIAWLMELIDIDARVAARVDLVIGPDRAPVTLDR